MVLCPKVELPEAFFCRQFFSSLGNIFFLNILMKYLFLGILGDLEVFFFSLDIYFLKFGGFLRGLTYYYA